jgi:cell shape-determining protein MreC
VTFDRRHIPVAALTVALAASAAVGWMPAAWSSAVRGTVAAWIRPGQIAAIAVRRQIALGMRRVRQHFQTVAEWTEMEAEVVSLREENDRLKDELAAARNNPCTAPRPSSEDTPEPLLRADCVEARVLGQQAIAYLSRRQLLDVGQRGGAEPDALVVAAQRPALIDCGLDHRLKPGQLALCEARVWGQIVEVGPYTSVVRTVTEPGYRDLVRLVGPSAAADHRYEGPQGVLEGAGSTGARIRLVPVTEPVSVGDLVYTAADQGIQAEPLFYGRVTRIERSVDAADWEIWMEPAARTGTPQRVAVLRTELNPRRVADRSMK